jgi:glycosyltransferase involved in cell wall biosynthesis
MYTFLAHLTAYLRRHGIQYTRDLDDEYDILFVNSFAVPFEAVLAAKRANPELKVVQRLDGSARDYGRFGDADDRQAQVNLLADLTVFQSRYARFSVKEKHRIISQDGPIIYNPVDVDLFIPRGRSPGQRRPRVVNVAFSTNRKKGSWLIDSLARAHPDIDFVLCGRFEGVESLPNVNLTGVLDRETLAGVLRSCDVFLSLAENDSCPNVVLEALASGLPLVYRPSGGVPELVGECGVEMEPATFRRALEEVMSRQRELSEAARTRAVERFHPEIILGRYLEAIKSAARRPIPSYAAAFGLALRGYPPFLLPGRRSPTLAIGAVCAVGKRLARMSLSRFSSGDEG